MPEPAFALPYQSTDLRGQVALVTGRRADRLDALAATISRDGGTCLALPLDVAEAEQLTAAVETIENELGTVSHH